MSCMQRLKPEWTSCWNCVESRTFIDQFKFSTESLLHTDQSLHEERRCDAEVPEERKAYIASPPACIKNDPKRKDFVNPLQDSIMYHDDDVLKYYRHTLPPVTETRWQ